MFEVDISMHHQSHMLKNISILFWTMDRYQASSTAAGPSLKSPKKNRRSAGLLEVKMISCSMKIQPMLKLWYWPYTKLSINNMGCLLPKPGVRQWTESTTTPATRHPRLWTAPLTLADVSMILSLMRLTHCATESITTSWEANSSSSSTRIPQCYYRPMVCTCLECPGL